MIELVYETHSTTTDNEEEIATGWLPGKLSPRGRQQAAELGERRADLDIVFASDLARAIETVELAFPATQTFLDWRLRECDYGNLNGSPFAEVEAVRTKHIDLPFPGGESYRDVVARTASFLSDVRARWDGHRVCVVAHSANRWALQNLIEGTALEELVAAPFDWRPGWTFRV